MLKNPKFTLPNMLPMLPAATITFIAFVFPFDMTKRGHILGAFAMAFFVALVGGAGRLRCFFWRFHAMQWAAVGSRRGSVGAGNWRIAWARLRRSVGGSRFQPPGAETKAMARLSR